MPIKPGKYIHFKGGEYEVIGTAVHSETLEEMVVYRTLYGDGGMWVRPAAMWDEIIEHNGRRVRRFTQASDRPRAFPPLIEGRPKTLILGTFPSPVSRGKSQYYGNPRNMFWQIIFDISGVEFCNPDYDEKKRVLFKSGLALWDVIESCETVGALDSDIENPEYNMLLPEFIESNKITRVLFNGKKAHEFYRRGIERRRGSTSVEKIILPSTSPANARLSYAEKLSAWSDALKGL